MTDKAKQAWAWLTAGLAEAVLWIIARFRQTVTYRVILEDTDAMIEGPDGQPIGRLIEDGGAVTFQPPSLAQRLGGAAIDILVPHAWLFRRTLDPVAMQSVPFLDAFVRHHIERITPWRAPDVHYRILQQPMAGDPTRVSVGVCVVPRRLLKGWVAALETTAPRRLRIMSRAAPLQDDLAIMVGAASLDVARSLQRTIALGLVLLALGFGIALGWLRWDVGLVQDEIADQDQVYDQRKAVLARARRQDQGGHDMEAQLQEMRMARVRAVDIVEALAKALPDSAHLTGLTLQKTQMSITGISTDTSLLVPALEKSGRFADVAFGAATTKVENGQGDRFQLDMRIRDPAPASQ